MIQFCVVIPAYNESRTIREVVVATLRHARHIIVVDDGSTDNTTELLKDLPITVIKNNTNLGKAASLLKGMDAALTAGLLPVVTLDADGQHKPDDIARLLECASLHPDKIIIGARLSDRKAFPTTRYYANKTANFWISWAAGYAIEDSQSGFRLYPASLVKKMDLSANKKDSFVFESEVLIDASRKGYQSVSIPIEAIYSTNARPSYFRSVRDIGLIARMVAWKLIIRGMYPQGFYNYLIRPVLKNSKLRSIGGAGLGVLLLSILVTILSGGLTMAALLWKITSIARKQFPPCSADSTLVVLGKRLQQNSISQDYLARLRRTKILFIENPQRDIIILGGHTYISSTSESQAGKDWLVSQGIPSECIKIEQTSRHTLENFRHAYKSLSDQEKGIALITNRYHLARSHYMAEGLGIQHELCAAEQAFTWSVRNLVQLLKESFFLHWYLTAKYFARMTGSRSIRQGISNNNDEQ